GLGRGPGATLEQYQQQLGAVAADARLPAAFAAYQEVRFGALPFDGDRQARMATALAAVQALPRLPPQLPA
ncbi:MAG TPA: hypothetical protein VK348_03475, partial [Planctomycetota bacterium]|nr:hypothetical protein [Planctomycetota bacterium]